MQINFFEENKNILLLEKYENIKTECIHKDLDALANKLGINNGF